MKKAIISLVLLIVTASVLFSRSYKDPDPAQAEAYQKAIEAFYPRLEASEGGRATIKFIEDRLKADGIDYVEQSFAGLETDHSFSRIISVTIPGALPDTVILAIPLNHDLYAEKGAAGAAGIAAGMELAESFSTGKPPLTVRILFLGAEVPLLPDQTDLQPGGTGDYPLGSKLFLQGYFPESAVAVIYLALDRVGGDIAIRPGGKDLIAPSWLLKGIIEAAQEAGLGFRLASNRLLSYRLGHSEQWSPITPYLAQSIPAVLVTNADAAPPAEAQGPAAVRLSEPDSSLWYARLFTLVDRFLQDQRNGLSTDWDHHYLLLDLRDTYLFFGEHAALIMLMIVVGLALAYGVASRKRMRRYARTVARNFWNLPILLGIMFLFLLASTLLLQGFLVIRDFPSLWTHYPILFFAWKIALSLFLSTLAFRLLRRLPISRNGSFYSAAALFFLFLDVVIAAVINLSFVTYFLFGFVFCFLFTVTRIRWLKLILLVAGPILLLKAAWDALSVPELQLVQGMLLSAVRGNLLLAFVTLPFLLMVIRMDFLVRHPVRGRTSFATLLAMLVTGAGTLVLAGFLLFLHPFNRANPQPVTVIQHIDNGAGTDRLSLSSAAPLDDLSFTYGKQSFSLRDAGRRASVTLPSGPELIRVGRSLHAFLGREQTSLTVAHGPASPAGMRLYRILVNLSSSEPLVMYDANYPFTYTAANREADLHIGVDPPTPLRVDYTLPAGKSPAATVTAGFLNVPESCLPRSPAYRFLLRTEVTVNVPPTEIGKSAQ